MNILLSDKFSTWIIKFNFFHWILYNDKKFESEKLTYFLFSKFVRNEEVEFYENNHSNSFIYNNLKHLFILKYLVYLLSYKNYHLFLMFEKRELF